MTSIFISFCIILFFSNLLVLLVNGSSSRNIPTEVQQLQKELNELALNTENLKRGKAKLIEEINLNEIYCKENLSKLKSTQQFFLSALLNKNQTIGLLIQKILEEDVIHEKLESKLKQLYSDLDVLRLKYETKQQELFVLESRRVNGSDLYCETIKRKVGEISEQIHENEIQSRSLFRWQKKFTGNNLKEIAMQNKISLAKMNKSQLQYDVQSLTLKKENNKELCMIKESNLKQQIDFTEAILKSFLDSIEILNSNIHTSLILTESLIVEIEFAEKLLSTMKENVTKFKKAEQYFQRDKECYTITKGYY